MNAHGLTPIAQNWKLYRDEKSEKGGGILEEVPRMAHQLPSLFMIRARVREDPDPEEARYCLVSARSIQHPLNGTLWKMDIVEGSKFLVTGGSLRQDGIEGAAERFWHERDTRLDPSGVFYYENKIWRMKTYLVIPGQGQIWEYGMTHANKILPSRYNHVGNGRDGCKKWHFTLSDLNANEGVSQTIVPQVLEVPKVPMLPKVLKVLKVPKIPTHVFHAFAEGAIQKKEECPITMEPFTKENIGCLPCGHLFEKEGVRKALEGHGVCPTCRAATTVEDIQTW
jgi:hypothetical protein